MTGMNHANPVDTQHLSHIVAPSVYSQDKLKPSYHCVRQIKSNQSFKINQAEIIAVNSKPVAYPLDTVSIKKQHFKVYSSEMDDDVNAPIRGRDYCVNIDVLCPPILVNLRENSTQMTACLAPYEIDYFKRRGKNVVLFIHGYNVPFGDYPRQIVGIKQTKKIFIEPYNRHGVEFDPILAGSCRTFYRSEKMIADHFHYQFHQEALLKIKNYALNGTGACAWFIHMEDNLNLSTNHFSRNNYLDYMRVLHVTWSGDVGALNYMAAEDKADQAAKKLVGVIEQLAHHCLEIYVIAHSLGNRLLLQTMNTLGKQDKKEILSHVFLWQAAVPNTALSNDISRDTTVKNNGHFPYAYLAAKKITVLFSRRDAVLKKDYYLANILGVSPKMLNDESALNQLAKQNSKRRLFSNRKVKIYRRFLKHFLKLIFIHQNTASAVWKIKHLKQIDHCLNNIYRMSGNVSHALGYSGVDPNDPLMKQLISRQKLIIADTTPYIYGHSAMKIPNQAIIKHVYQRWIMGQSGIKVFGRYHLNF
jgi:hypothetical protein